MVTAAVLGIALSLEPKEPGLMRRKPRDPKAPILNGDADLADYAGKSHHFSRSLRVIRI